MELIAMGVANAVAVVALAYVAVRQRPSDLRIADEIVRAYEQGVRIQSGALADVLDRIERIEDQHPERPEDVRPVQLKPNRPVDEPIKIGEHQMGG